MSVGSVTPCPIAASGLAEILPGFGFVRVSFLSGVMYFAVCVVPIADRFDRTVVKIVKQREVVLMHEKCLLVDPQTRHHIYLFSSLAPGNSTLHN